MKEAQAQAQNHYPRPFSLMNNTPVTLRLMTPFDADRLLTFARSLPGDDLLAAPPP